MQELLEKLAKGEIPNFLEVMEAINEGTSCGWDFSNSPTPISTPEEPKTICELNGHVCCND
jgi:hypothetical protein